MKVLIGAAVAALLLPAPTIGHAACRFAAARVVGCFPDDAALAAKAYQRFRNNQAALSSPSVKDVLASAGCRVIVSSPQRPFHIAQRNQLTVATLSGYEPVSIVEFKTSGGGNVFSVDSRWISGQCDPPPPPTVCVFGDPCNPR